MSYLSKTSTKIAAALGGVAVLTAAVAITATALAQTKHTSHSFMRPAVVGTVSTISGNTITVAGKNSTTYTIDATNATITKFTNGTKSTITVSGITDGDTIAVMGTVSGTNVTATTITDGMPMMGKFGRGKDMRPIVGTVASVSGNTITVTGKNNTTYTVDATNATVNKVANGASTTITVSAIQNGDTISAFGTLNGTTLIATKIIDGTLPKGSMMKAATFGTVASVSGNTITVTGKNNTTYTVDATNATVTQFMNGSSTTIPVSSVKTGDMVIVFGTTSGTSITATKIIDGMKPFGRGMGGRRGWHGPKQQTTTQ